MSSLERIIRPFQQGDVFTARRAIPTPMPEPNKISDDTPTLSWSGPNKGIYEEDTPRPLIAINITELEEDKGRRVVKRERIENPDDKEQYIMVDRLMQTTLRGTDGREMTLKFQPWDK